MPDEKTEPTFDDVLWEWQEAHPEFVKTNCDPGEYRCQKCGGHCGGYLCKHTQWPPIAHKNHG